MAMSTLNPYYESDRRAAVMDILADSFDARGVANEVLEAWTAQERAALTTTRASSRLPREFRLVASQMIGRFARILGKQVDIGLIIKAMQVLESVGVEGMSSCESVAHRVVAAFLLAVKFDDASQYKWGPYASAAHFCAKGMGLSWECVSQEERSMFLAGLECPSTSISIDTWTSAFSARLEIVMKGASTDSMVAVGGLRNWLTLSLVVSAPSTHHYMQREMAVGMFALLLSAAGLLPLASIFTVGSEQAAAWFAAKFQEHGGSFLATATSEERNVLLMEKALEIATDCEMSSIRKEVRLVADMLSTFGCVPSVAPSVASSPPPSSHATTTTAPTTCTSRHGVTYAAI